MNNKSASKFRRSLKSDPSSCFQNNICDIPYLCPTNDTCQSIEITLPPGTYRLEVWGAKGGDGIYESTRPGGPGGYSKGELTIKSARKLYVAVGGSGSTSSTKEKIKGGNNGGGYIIDANIYAQKASGGGATDIRLDVNNLYHRIIVAGGGGGGNSAASYGCANGGVGGGTNGGKSSGHYSADGCHSPDSKTDGNGGTQTEGGKMGSYTESSNANKASQPNGIFGFGENIDGFNPLAGAGGGGWYGGGAGNGHGGGGSGFVLNAESVKNTPSDYAFQSSESDFLSNYAILSGNDQFLSPSNKSVTGNNGNGFARITIVKFSKKFCFLSNGKCYVSPLLKQFIGLYMVHTVSA